MPTCIFVHTQFYSNVCRERCQLKKPFLLERAANRQRHILGFRRHELFKF